MPKPFAVALLALSVAISGCGTMVNMTTSAGNMPPKPFGGIAYDLQAGANGDFSGILDLPASLVGDVVTLPDVLVANRTERRRDNATPAGLADDAAGAKTVSKGKRVYNYVSGSQPVQDAPAEQSESVDR
jgi:uncharacterized protein YceK